MTLISKPIPDTDTDPSSKKKMLVRRYIERMMEGVGSVIIKEPPRTEFRVSSFPYCGVLDALKLQDPPEGEFTYGFSFYVGVGTAIHESLQTFLPHVEKLGPSTTFGKWKCKQCKAVTEGVTVRPSKCKGCKHKHFDYEEVDFAYKALSGHLDYLTFHPKIGWVAFEFKSTGSKYLNKFGYAKYLPFEKHPHQIETYVALLKLQYNITVSFYSIIYYARDDPHSNDFLPEPRGTKLLWKPFTVEVTEEMLDSRIESIDTACASRKSSLALIKSPSLKQRKKVWDKRPCHTRQQYDDVMSAAFFGEELCPHLNHCLTNKMSRVLGTAGETAEVIPGKMAGTDRDL